MRMTVLTGPCTWLALFMMVACSPDQESTGCNEAPPFSCNVSSGTAMIVYDDLNDCLGTAQEISDVCTSSIFNAPTCYSASTGAVCAVSPAGGLYLVLVRGDQDVTGPGWRSTPHRTGYGPNLPPDAVASASDQERCSRARCAPSCPDSAHIQGFYCPGGSMLDASLRDR
jgi:hypothetical protein